MLKVKFWQIENVLCAKILEQTEQNINFEYATNDGIYKIISCGYPEMINYAKTFYVRGSHTEKKDVVFCTTFNSEMEATEYKEGISFAIQAYNRSLCCSLEKPEIEKEVIRTIVE